MITNVKDVNETNLTAEMDHIAQRLNLSDAKDALYFPKFFQLETVRVCDARCPFCAIDQWDKSVPLMPDKLFEKIATELTVYSGWIEAVCIQRAGEPLLDKKLGPRIRRLKEAGIPRGFALGMRPHFIKIFNDERHRSTWYANECFVDYVIDRQNRLIKLAMAEIQREEQAE